MKNLPRHFSTGYASAEDSEDAEEEAGETFLAKESFPPHPLQKNVSEQGSHERSGCFFKRASAPLEKTSFAQGAPGGASPWMLVNMNGSSGPQATE